MTLPPGALGTALALLAHEGGRLRARVGHLASGASHTARFLEPGALKVDEAPLPGWGSIRGHRVLLQPGHGLTSPGR